jgi:selenocysteine lyase/cysteine desulfurase
MRGAAWTTANTFEPAPDARRFENWEFAYALVLGLGAAAQYAANVGIEHSGRRAREHAANLRKKLDSLPGFRVLDRGKELAAIVTVTVADWEAPELVRILRERGINTSASLGEYAVIDMAEKQVSSALRISPHYYNTEAEIDLVIDALQSLPKKASANRL